MSSSLIQTFRWRLIQLKGKSMQQWIQATLDHLQNPRTLNQIRDV